MGAVQYAMRGWVLLTFHTASPHSAEEWRRPFSRTRTPSTRPSLEWRFTTHRARVKLKRLYPVALTHAD